MTTERLFKIFDKVFEKYKYKIVSPLMVQSIYNDLSAVVRGLHKTEHFLNVSIDTQSKIILCLDEETLNFLGVLPYLDNRLMKDNSEYFIYIIKEGNAYQQCAVKFVDLHKEFSNRIGFEVVVYPITVLGVYHADTNTFMRWRE